MDCFSFSCFVLTEQVKFLQLSENLILFSSCSSWNYHISYSYSRSYCSWLLQGQSCSQNRLPQSCYKDFLQEEGQVRDNLVLLFLSKASWTCWPRELSYIHWKRSSKAWLNTISSIHKSTINLIRFLWHKDSCGGNNLS